MPAEATRSETQGDRCARHCGTQRAARSAMLLVLAALCAAPLGGCGLFNTTPPPPPAQALPSPVPAVTAPQPPAPRPDILAPPDRAARRLLAFNEHLRAESAQELSAEIARMDEQRAARSALRPSAPASAPTTAPMDAPPAPTAPLSHAADGATIELALALAQRHEPGDRARARALLEPLAGANAADAGPWQGLARLLLARIGEEQRLEDQLEQQAGQRRETQRTIQQLTEKLEALKAIERSMISSGGKAMSGASGEPGPKAP